MCIFCVLFASRMQLRGIPTLPGPVPRAILLNSPVSLCLLPVTLPAGRTRRSSILRTHFQVPYPVSPVFAALTKTAEVCTNNSHSGSHRVQPSGTRHSSLISRHLHSSPFHSYRCALFCTLRNSTLFFSIGSALFAQNHPGGGMGLLSPRVPTLSEAYTRIAHQGAVFFSPRVVAGLPEPPLQKENRPGGREGRGRWLSSGPGSFRTSSS